MVYIKQLTETENKVLNKRLKNKKLSQVESNYLSRSIRPKLEELKETRQIDVDSILQKIHYNQKGKSIERTIVRLVKRLVKGVDSVILYGSAVQTNYHEYKDIDVLVLTKSRSWGKEKEKYGLAIAIKKEAKSEGLDLDLQIIERKVFDAAYPSSPDLIYQMKDSKVVYGAVKVPDKFRLTKMDLQMKLDWSDIGNTRPTGLEIYRAIRNAFLVKMLLKKVIDNSVLKRVMSDEIGKNLVEKLKSNRESRAERKVALVYLRELSANVRQDIGGASWERIRLSVN